MRRKRLLVLLIILTCLLSGCGLAGQKEDNSKDDANTEYSLEESIEKAKESYKSQGYDYSEMIDETEVYTYTSDYLNWGKHKDIVAECARSGNEVTYDDDGIPMVKHGGKTEFEYNPVTILQHTLTTYGKVLSSEKNEKEFLGYVDYCIDMMEDDGSFRYYYDYPYYLNPDNYMKSGWTSAMNNGHMLSVLARAYSLDPQEKYIEAAERTLSFLETPVSENGVATDMSDLDESLKDLVIYEEYPAEPNAYTLNGFMFTLLGIYDWSCVESPSQEKAKQMFDGGIETLRTILPYFDVGGFTAYDLGFITYDTNKPNLSPKYHMIHIAFCHVFYEITNAEEFRQYYDLWGSYVE